MNSFSSATNGGLKISESGRSSLHVLDNRTGDFFTIPIHHNSINASDFMQIKSPQNGYHADQNEQGIRIYDPGYSNTAVSESKITYMSVDLQGIHLSKPPINVG